ncbi:hypothetical protein HPULCUR_004224 [Helicostylum pulchrum]|uniref:Uncharacterized protein n=1 Tax=Helicostylum pulchrum TaxID=562976 RepID=A0ABP9XX22_9FUNG
MSEYQNRAEKRSLQRVQLRKIRTEYKQQMKAVCSNCFDYNAKKFHKTLLYYRFKQESIGIAEDASADCNSQDTTETYISGESPSDIFTSQMNTDVDIPVIFIYQEEDPSPQLDTDMAFDNYEYAPVTEIYQEEDHIRTASYPIDQDVKDSAIYEEECIQANTLVLSYDLDHAVKSTHVTDILEEAFSIQISKNVTLGDTEKITEGIFVAEISEVEDLSISSDATSPLATDTDITTALTTEFSQKVGSSNHASTEDKNHVSVTSMQVNDVSEERETPKESIAADTLDSKDVNITADKEECDAEEAPSSDTGAFTVMADKEATVIFKDIDITQDVESFKLEWNILSRISVHMFDCFLDTLGELQTRTDALVNAIDSENTELGDDKKDTEEHLDGKEDDVHKEDEVGEKEEDERSFVSKKKINSSFSEKPMKEVTWMLTPPSSIMSVVCEEKTSSPVTPPQNITDVVFDKPLYVQPNIIGEVEGAVAVSAILEVTFSPVEEAKKKRLQTLRVSFH